MQTLDDIDLSILRLLQDDGHLSNVMLARQINLSPPATHARVKRLEADGYIQRYAAVLDKDKLGFDLTCFFQVGIKWMELGQVDQFAAAVGAMPEVLECHNITGDYDYLLKVAVRNRRELEHFVSRKLSQLPGVVRFHTSLVFAEIKSTSALPLGQPTSVPPNPRG